MSLTVESVSMQYTTGQPVLDKLDFHLADKESVAIMGPSGSGKTTLISILGLIVDPTAGRVLIDGEPVPQREVTRHVLRASLFGWIMQTVNVLSRRSCLENVVIPLLAQGFRRGDAEGRGREALAWVGLQDMVDQPVRLLSGGEVQRACIARALAHRPRYLLADEPTGQLDRATSMEVLDALVRLRDETGACLVVVTHDQEVAAVCDRVVDLVDGSLRAR